MAEYIDADVELVARAGFEHSGMHQWEDITDYMREEWRSVARKQLSALAAAGRLTAGPLLGVRTADGRLHHPADVTFVYEGGTDG